MHIALVTHHYSPETGAPQRRWDALVGRFVAAGHRVTVLAPSPHYPTGRAEDLTADLRPGAATLGRHGERVLRLRFREHSHRLVSRTVDQCVTAAHAVGVGTRRLRSRHDRPDVVIATAPGIPSIGAGLLLARTLRTPLVVEMRDAWPDLIAPSGMWGPDVSQGWRTRVTRGVHRAITHLQRDAAAVVTTTDSFAEVLADRRMRRVDVVRNGADLSEIPALAAPPLDRPGLRVLYLGTLGRSQGLSTAVRAAVLLRDRGIDVRLRLVGSGADEPALRALVRALDAPVDVVGRVPRDQVVDHYTWADTLLVSLRRWGPFEWTVPSKLYESLATGRHVSAAVAGEAARVLTESRAGDVVAPEDADALADLWEQLAADRRRLDTGSTGRAWAQEHANDDVLARRYLDLLGEVTR